MTPRDCPQRRHDGSAAAARPWTLLGDDILAPEGRLPHDAIGADLPGSRADARSWAATGSATTERVDDEYLEICELTDDSITFWNRAGLSQHPRRNSRKQTKTRNLLERLRDREPDILRYANDLTVPFTNNRAEGDIRMSKTQIKISGTMRTTHGAARFARIRGYISTCRKNGIDALTAIHDLFTGNPWTPGLIHIT